VWFFHGKKLIISCKTQLFYMQVVHCIPYFMSSGDRLLMSGDRSSRLLDDSRRCRLRDRPLRRPWLLLRRSPRSRDCSRRRSRERARSCSFLRWRRCSRDASRRRSRRRWRDSERSRMRRSRSWRDHERDRRRSTSRDRERRWLLRRW